MNLDLLKAAESKFLMDYPGGFENEEIKAIARKHKLGKMTELVHDVFAEEKFLFPEQIVEDMVKVISRASMVSVFEKPKFRDYARSLDQEKKEILAKGLYEQLYGDQELGFNMMLDILVEGKMAKWSLMTIIMVYFDPDKEIFVKPTTTKNVIRVFELEDMIYKPRPSYDFYKRYRDHILEMKSHVSDLCGGSNPGFTGFLMMTMEK